MSASPARTGFLERWRALPRDKADTLLLIGATVLVLLPHLRHLPPWISLLTGATLAWRALLTWRGRRMPQSSLLLPLAVASMGAVLVSFDTLLGREAGVAMLVLLVAFKMLEMHARRDLFVVIFLCFFLLLTTYFHDQGIGTAVLSIAAVMLLLATQLSFQFTGRVPPLGVRLRWGAKIVGLAAPLALVLYFAFPRIQGPLWGMPQDARIGRSGLSDTMAPGQLSSLAQSDEAVFTVRFSGPVPAQPQLYWRGVVLGDFDGRTWRPPRSRTADSLADRPQLLLYGVPIRHQVTLEPIGTRYLFALDMARQAPRPEGVRAFVSAEREYSSADPVTTRVRYEVESYSEYRLHPDRLGDPERWLELPAARNPLTRQMGADLRAIAQPAERARQVLLRFRNEPFRYTLQPPTLGRDRVDEFMFGTRAGYCEHYASAFVVLMRAAGVPARVVTGYQGGERNPVNDVLTVRQADAHAWAEIWLESQGWVRVDPTAAVAPERVERSVVAPSTLPLGLERLNPLLNMQLQPDSWLGQLRYQLAALDHGWQQLVLEYSPQRQRQLLDNAQRQLKQASVWAGLLALAMLLALWLWQRRRVQGDPLDALYSRLCRRLAILGVPRAAHESPQAYAARLSGLPWPPTRKDAALRFLALYGAYKYGPAPSDPGLHATLKRLFRHTR
jgi:transglutaminase-like putative cysteine protease